MLASFPASMLNQNTPDLGILNRLKLDPSRSSLLRCIQSAPRGASFDPPLRSTIIAGLRPIAGGLALQIKTIEQELLPRDVGPRR